MKNKTRLDMLVVDRGLAASRERARALILAGQVRVNGLPVTKAGTDVPVDAEVTVDGPDHQYASRGGVKLAHALDVFGIDVSDRLALDIGASTGGFTDVLLQRGARRVVALDVEGESAALGKTTGKDAAAGKPTYPSIYGLAESRRLAASCIERAVESLDRASLGGQLAAIAGWIVSRTH